jgi:hypothetical protein
MGRICGRNKGLPCFTDKRKKQLKTIPYAPQSVKQKSAFAPKKGAWHSEFRQPAPAYKTPAKLIE